MDHAGCDTPKAFFQFEKLWLLIRLVRTGKLGFDQMDVLYNIRRDYIVLVLQQGCSSMGGTCRVNIASIVDVKHETQACKFYFVVAKLITTLRKFYPILPR